MIALGIDPGLSGALAWLCDSRIVHVADMPTMARTAGKGNECSAAHLADLLERHPPDLAFVERVHAMPKQGVVSVFSLGHTLGTIMAVLACRRIRTHMIEPTTWKRSMGLWRAEKDKSVARALQLFPDMASRLTRKCDHGRAEAMLLAYYGSATLPAFVAAQERPPLFDLTPTPKEIPA